MRFWRSCGGGEGFGEGDDEKRVKCRGVGVMIPLSEMGCDAGGVFGRLNRRRLRVGEMGGVGVLMRRRGE